MREYTSVSTAIQRLNRQIGFVSASKSSKSAASVASLSASHRALTRLSLQVQGLASSYINQKVSATSGANPQVLTAASPATSDRVSKIDDYGLIGLLAGVAVALLGVGARRSRRKTGGSVRIHDV